MNGACSCTWQTATALCDEDNNNTTMEGSRAERPISMVVYIWQQWLQLYSLCQAFFYFFRGFFILVFLFQGVVQLNRYMMLRRLRTGAIVTSKMHKMFFKLTSGSFLGIC